jgi:hypothetical protein
MIWGLGVREQCEGRQLGRDVVATTDGATGCCGRILAGKRPQSQVVA